MKMLNRVTCLVVCLAVVCLVMLLISDKTHKVVRTDVDVCQSHKVVHVDVDDYQRELEHIAVAFAKVESCCNADAVNGDCVGYLQIKPIVVKEANRVLGVDCFTLEDRLTVSGSIAIFETIMSAYNPTLDLRIACKIWNPHAGEWYYKCVLAEYNKIDPNNIVY